MLLFITLKSGNLIFNSSNKSLSISIRVTFPFKNLVKTPFPGPISSIFSSFLTSKKETIFLATFSSSRKCWSYFIIYLNKLIFIILMKRGYKFFKHIFDKEVKIRTYEIKDFKKYLKNK